MKLMEKKPVEITNHSEYPSWGALYCMNNVSIYDLKYVDKLNNGYVYRFIKKESTFDSHELLIRIDDLYEVDKIYSDPEKYWEWFYNLYNHKTLFEFTIWSNDLHKVEYSKVYKAIDFIEREDKIVHGVRFENNWIKYSVLMWVDRGKSPDNYIDEVKSMIIDFIDKNKAIIEQEEESE